MSASPPSPEQVLRRLTPRTRAVFITHILGFNALDDRLLALQQEAEAVAADAVARFGPTHDSWMCGFSREFSRELGGRGWLGMTWPAEHGGGGRPPLDRGAEVPSNGERSATTRWAAGRQDPRGGPYAVRIQWIRATTRRTCIPCHGP